MASYRASPKRVKSNTAKQIDEDLPICIQRFIDVSKLYKITFFLLPLAAFIEGIGICIPYWLDVKVVDFDVIKKEYHEGLWERCDPKTKCEYRKEADIEDFEFAVRAMCVIAMFCSVCSLVLMFLSICVKFTAEKTFIHVANLICCFVSCGLALLALFVFAGETKPNRAYFLSYGFYFTMLGAVLMGVCGTFVVLEIGLRFRSNKMKSGFHPGPPIPDFREDDGYDDRKEEFQDEFRMEPYRRGPPSVDDDPRKYDDSYHSDDHGVDSMRGSHHSMTNTNV